MKRVFIYSFLLYSFLSYCSCAYFNTFYITKKYFNEGLKAIEQEKRTPQRSSIQQYQSSTTTYPSVSAQRPPVSTIVLNNLDKCIEKGSKLLELYPTSKWVDDCLYILGRSFYYKQEYLEAGKKFEELITIFPESEFVPETKFWWAKTYLELKSFSNAERMFSEVINSDAKKNVKDEAMLGLAEILYIQEKYDLAVEEYKNLVNNIGNKELKAEAQLKIGECYFKLLDYKNASESFYKARDFYVTQEQKYQAEFKYSISKKNLGNYDDAINIFKVLLNDGKNVNHFPELRIETADCLNREKKFEEAISIYEDIGNIYTKTPYASEAYYNIGLIYYKEFLDFKKAYEYFKKSTDMFQTAVSSKKAFKMIDDINIMNAIKDSITLENKEKIEEKIPSDTVITISKKTKLEKFKRIEGRAKNRYLLGEIFLDKVGQVDSALYYFNEIISNFQESTFAPKSLLQLYDIYSNKLNNPNEAKKFLEKLVDEYSQSDFANAAREKLGLPKIVLLKDSLIMEFLNAEELYFDKKQLDSAIEKYRKISTDFPDFEFSPKCIYVAGWHYENEELNIDKAIDEYKKLVENYPESEFAKLIVLKVMEYENKKADEEKKKQEQLKKEKEATNLKEGEQKAEDKSTISNGKDKNVSETNEGEKKSSQKEILQKEIEKKKEIKEK